MADHTNPDAVKAQPKAGRQLRIAGIFILVCGLSAAGWVYWKGASAGDLMDDVATPQTSKVQARAIEVNVGKMGLLVDEWSEDLQDPANQAAVIAAVSILAAAGCLYFARLQARGAEMDRTTDDQGRL
jgi:hypothetical protein